MAPGRPTRATRSAGKAQATDSVTTPASGRSTRPSLISVTPVTNPQNARKRGRPSANLASIGSESVSSALSLADSNSEAGDYSTAVTSTAVTPAPSTSTKLATSTKATSSRLVVELPQMVADEGTSLPKGFGSGSSRARRSRAAVSYTVKDSEEEEDDDDDVDAYGDAALAIRLQQEEYGEEDNAARAPKRAHAFSFTSSVRRRTRASAAAMDDDSDEDFKENGSQDELSPRPSALDPKGKGKAAAQPSTMKRSSGATRRTTTARSMDVDLADDDEDEPLARSAPARKRRRLDLPSGIDGDEDELEFHDSADSDGESIADSEADSSSEDNIGASRRRIAPSRARARGLSRVKRSRAETDRRKLEKHHPELRTMWETLEAMPPINAGKALQPTMISRQMKPFQLEGLAWMQAMEKTTDWKGGLLGDEMGLGKTIQAVSLIMSDYPAGSPSLVLVPPVAMLQWTNEINSYTDGTLNTLVFHVTNPKAKKMTAKELKKYDVIIMSYNSLESLYRKQEKGHKRKEDVIVKARSAIHTIKFHRVILDEAHCIKTRTTMTAKACFALKAEYRWCLSGTPLQNRIGEFFSLVRFLKIVPFCLYYCKECPCAPLEWSMTDEGTCTHCRCYQMSHVSVFNQELLNPIQKFGHHGEGKEAFEKLRLLTKRIMLRRLKKDHTNALELPVKEINIDRQFFGEVENDFAKSIMTSSRREFNTYVASGVVLNNYANIFGLIMQMRQVADHPDLILKKDSAGGQNIRVCCICDDPAEDAIQSNCKHDFCRECGRSYLLSQEEPDCPKCHIPLQLDLTQTELEQDEAGMKKSSIINRIKMENWTSSSKIELLVHELHRLRSNNASHKSIIFSQFTTMLQLVEWRLCRAGITTVMLDGSMSPQQRQKSIDHFMNNANVECFLVSLKAGGVALNLTEASRVFIVDPWWNPAAEWQSADRCHRIGQTRPCTITRLCIEDSVESRMVLLQEKKTNMINSTINSDDAAMESLSPADLQFLFRGS